MAEIIETEIKPKLAKISEIQEKAEEIKAKRALPPKPGDRVSFKELQQWLALLSPDAEERLTIWVYRREPIINRQLVDPQADNNIDIIYNNFLKLSEEYMIANHGGGNYKFTIKDEDKPKTQLGGYFEATLNIPMIDNPPKLDLREVEWDNPRNKGFKAWCRAKKMINENNMPVIEKKDETTVVQQGVDANMLKMMLDFTAKMSEKEQIALKRQIGGEDALSKNIGELMLEKMKQEDPNKQMSTMIAMITAIKGFTPEPKADNTLAVIMPMFMTMMNSQIESGKQQFQMMMEMFKSNKSEPTEGGSEIEKLRAIIDLSKEIKGGGTGSHERSTTEVVVDALAPILGPVLNIVGNIVAMNAAAKGVKQETIPVVIPTVQRSNLQTLYEQNTMNHSTPSNEAANLITQFEPIILNKLSGEGWEFAAWVSEGFGDMAAAGMAKYGVDGLMSAAKSVPTFWQKVEASYGEAHLRKWLTSLCNYKEIMIQMEVEENGEVGLEKEKV